MKKIYFVMMFSLLLLNVSMFVVANVTLEDPKEDLRKFDVDYVDDETKTVDLSDDIGDINDIYDFFYDEWDNDNTDEVEPLTDDEYEDNDYIDLVEIGVEKLEEETAVLYIEVCGDLTDTSRTWILFIWSVCDIDDDTPSVLFVCTYVPNNDTVFVFDTESEEDYTEYGWIDDDEVYEIGDSEYNEDGSKLEMDFPSELWDDGQDCEIRCVIITVDDKNFDDVKNWYIDIYSNAPSVIDDAFFWFVIFIMITILLIAIVVYVVHKKWKNKKITKRNDK